MSLIDLSQVTSAFMNLLRLNINEVINGGNPPVVTISPEPPDKVGSVTNTLSLYAYHVTEDPYYKNTLGPGIGVPSVARAPMGLCLYYILTAHHDSSGEEDALTRQRLLGWALKSLHDIPVITDNSEIDGQPLLPVGIQGQGNRLEMTLRPISPEEALGFWSTEDQTTTRLSAYYEARVIMLDPEEPTNMPGIVLSVGSFVQQLGAPEIACTQNTIAFSPPGATTPVEIESSPARILIGADPGAQLELLGTNLAGGESRVLKLRGSSTAPAIEGPIVIDPDLNPAWDVQFLADRVTATVQNTINLQGGGSVTLFPGVYTAQVEIVVASEILLGEVREVKATSNEASFFITPGIVDYESIDPPMTEFRLMMDFDPTPAGGVPELEYQLVIDGQVYVQIPTGNPAPGEFRLTATDIRVDPPFSIIPPTTEFHPLQITVNGAASLPFWLEFPEP